MSLKPSLAKEILEAARYLEVELSCSDAITRYPAWVVAPSSGINHDPRSCCETLIEGFNFKHGIRISRTSW